MRDYGLGLYLEFSRAILSHLLRDLLQLLDALREVCDPLNDGCSPGHCVGLPLVWDDALHQLAHHGAVVVGLLLLSLKIKTDLF